MKALESIRVPVQDVSQSAEARRLARKLAARAGLDEVRSEQIAIVVTEASTNILKHAGSGEILLQVLDYPPGAATFEVLALDQGPGMNLEQCMRDGFSTSSSPGQGLGAIARLSPSSDFYSLPSRGTALLVRWPVALAEKVLRGTERMNIGAVNIPKPGEDVCGDFWGSEHWEDTTTIMVADGLGHGYDARVASAEAIRMLHEYPRSGPRELIERCHGALRGTRGAAAAVARIDVRNGTLTFSGLGNISAGIYSGGSLRCHLVSVNGTAGHNAHRLQEYSYPWPQDGILVMHSDGLTTSTSIGEYPRLPARDASLIAGVLYRDFCRKRDDATVVVAKAA